MAKKAKDIGIEAKAPKEVCNSDKCPWHGHLKIRGRIFNATVVSHSADSAIMQWNYYRYIQKYERSERRKTRIAAHNPSCIDAKIGDTVRIGECRQISKTKCFVIFERL